MRNKREHLGRAKVLLLAVASLIIGTAPSLTSSGLASAQATAPSWSYTGSLNTPRDGYTATLLPNGKVLVTGGRNADGILASAELYNPSTGTWGPTGNLNAARVSHSATLLQNGKVLVAGGWANSCCQELPDTTAELYDPATGKWSLTGNLNAGRVAHTATLLSNGTVLFAGGGSTSTAELYNPGTGTWSFTGSLNGFRVGHAATLLQDGKVLVVGGCADLGDCYFELDTAELYNPNTGAWSNTGSLNTVRYIVNATTLPNGNVLAAGGAGGSDNFELNSAELYSPATGGWSYTGSLLSRRVFATATLLPSGQVLIAGGTSRFSRLDTAELYDPATGNWHETAGLNTERYLHTATLLLNGKVLVVGGYRNGDFALLQSAELYDSGGSSTINPIDDAQFFVRQHYLDFLGREPDPVGLAFWTNEISSCGSDPQCVEVKRVNVSAAFFLSIEFQETGYLAYRTYKVAYGDASSPNVSIPVPMIRLNEFLLDAQRLGQGVQVGIGDWQGQLEANKNSYTREFVTLQRFLTAYPLTITAAQFVDQLNQNAGNVLSPGERDQLIAELSAAADVTMGRASVLLRVAENAELRQQEFNRAFVLMQYYGYLRRNPNDAPDADFSGWKFWLDKLNQFNGNFIHAEMVKAFLVSQEYRRRFGSP